MPSVMDPEQVHVPGAAGNTDAAGVENRESGRPCTSRALPQIDAGDQDIPRVAKLAWDALERANDPPRLFLHGRQPIRIEGTDHGSPVLQPLSPDRLWHELARAAAWFRMKYNRAVSAKPPRDVVSDMLADPNPRFPVLERIVQVPVFLSNGQLLDAPGYHAQGGVYYVPRPGFDPPSVSAHPTGRDVEMARSLIVEDLLGDFPFTGKAELANAVALLLLPFVRPLIDGPTPLHLVEKPTPGTGAGLMTEVIFSLALGGSPPILTLGSNENETSWTITATLSQSPTVVLIDNVHALSSAALSAAITAEIWSGRIISTSQLARLPVRCAWVATGNNPTLSQEITRRTVRIRLDADVEHPWERTNFRHPDLRGWVRANRSNLVEAALTLIQAWITTGQPNGPVSFGMFEAWSRVLGGILETAGIKGFLANRGDLYHASNDDSRVWTQFFRRWFERHEDTPVGVNELWRLITATNGDPIDLDLGGGNDRSQRTLLGRQFVQMRDCRFGPYRLTSAGERRGAQQWRLVRDEQTGAST